MRRIYLDYASTTPVDSDVLAAMLSYFSEKFGNPGSLHSFGQEAQIAIDNARSKVADFLGCLTQEIIFTGSATEANNLAIIGAVRAAKKAGVKNPHVITSAIEHKSVLEPIRKLEKDGEIELTILNVSKNSLIDLEQLKKSLKENTVLVSIIYANNEIGTVQPISEISKIIKNFRNWKLGTALPLLHTDAAQAANYLNMKAADLGVDLLTLSSQKIYGPKGTGVLYVKKGVLIEPQILGGEQEYGKRAGTENVPNIVGMGAAIVKINEYKNKNGQILELRNFFIDNVLAKIKTASLNGNIESCLPNVANILFKGINSADLLMMLDMEGIAVSAGSACQARGISGPSYVLRAMGLSEQDAKSSIRFSFGRQTTKEDIDYALEILVKLVNKLTPDTK
mgnify:CR=1 FL=1